MMSQRKTTPDPQPMSTYPTAAQTNLCCELLLPYPGQSGVSYLPLASASPLVDEDQRYEE